MHVLVADFTLQRKNVHQHFLRISVEQSESVDILLRNNVMIDDLANFFGYLLVEQPFFKFLLQPSIILCVFLYIVNVDLLIVKFGFKLKGNVVEFVVKNMQNNFSVISSNLAHSFWNYEIKRIYLRIGGKIAGFFLCSIYRRLEHLNEFYFPGLNSITQFTPIFSKYFQ